MPPAGAASSAGEPALENLQRRQITNVTYYGACISQVLMSPSNHPLRRASLLGVSNA